MHRRREGAQSPNYPDDLLDKEAMAASGTAVDVTTTNFIELCGIPFFGFGQIELYRSLDRGRTWRRVIIQPDESTVTDPSDPLCGADGIVNQGSYESQEVNVTADPADDECVLRTGGPLTNPTLKKAKKSSLVDVYKVRSVDGGVTWTIPARITTVMTNWCQATPRRVPGLHPHGLVREADAVVSDERGTSPQARGEAAGRSVPSAADPRTVPPTVRGLSPCMGRGWDRGATRRRRSPRAGSRRSGRPAPR